MSARDVHTCDRAAHPAGQGSSAQEAAKMKRRELVRFQFEHALLEFAHTRAVTTSAQLKAGRDCAYPARARAVARNGNVPANS
jgi:hypothetical protein